MFVYTLTQLTGRSKNAGRTYSWLTFEVPQRVFWVTLIGFGVSLPVALFFALFIQMFAIFIPPVIIAATFFLFEQRMRSGLELNRATAYRDKHRSGVGEFHMCNVPVDDGDVFALIIRSSVPAIREDDVVTPPTADHIRTRRGDAATMNTARDLLGSSI